MSDADHAHLPPGARPRPVHRRTRRDPSIPTLLRRGAARHCPLCGEGHLFRRWFTMVEHCPRCGLPFAREPGWVLGAMTINTAWTFVAMLVTMLVGFVLTYPDIATFWVAFAAGAAAVVTPILGYPFSKTVWIAVDLAMVPARATELRIEYLLDWPPTEDELTEDEVTEDEVSGEDGSPG